MRRIPTLDLFSGIGAFTFGLEATGRFRTVAFVEVDEACRAVLRQQFPGVPVFNDVREVSADGLRAAGVVPPRAICGGFPCQPHSVAGKRRGTKDDRHLWPEFARLVRELRPDWVIGENVPGIRTTAADEVMGDLEAAGYAVGAFVVGADDVGAPHRRKRVWFVAHAEHGRRERGAAAVCAGAGATLPSSDGADVGHAGASRRTPAGGDGIALVGTTANDAARAGEDRREHVADAADDGLAFGEGFGRHLLAELEAAHRIGRSGIWPRGVGAQPGLGGTADGAAEGVDEAAGDGIEFPTPSAARYGSNVGGAAGRVGPERLSLDSMAARGMWPTPTRDPSVTAISMDAAAREAERLHPRGQFTLATKMAEAEGFWPPPSASLGTNAGLVTPQKGREGGTLVEAVSARMWPTPNAVDHKGPNPLDRRPPCDDDLPTRIERQSFPVEAWERGVPRVIPRGAPGRTTRLQQLGNSVVWLVPFAIANAIVAYEIEQGED